MFDVKVCLAVFAVVAVQFANASRCFQCRSRGEQGSCRDPFAFNATDVEKEHGLAAIPCASGWCGKVLEGGGTYSVDDYDQAVQRMCLQRGPDDGEGRCANTVYNYKKVYMCFCRGDLCNAASLPAGLAWSTALVLSVALQHAVRGLLCP